MAAPRRADEEAHQPTFLLCCGVTPVIRIVEETMLTLSASASVRNGGISFTVAAKADFQAG